MTNFKDFLNIIKEHTAKDADMLFEDEVKIVYDFLKKYHLNVTFDNDLFEQDVNLKIAKALSNNYFVIYYVNLKDDTFISYSNSDDYKKLNIETKGENFFKLAVANARTSIYPDDLTTVIANLSKDKIIDETKDGKDYTFSYRLMLNGNPTYVILKATRLVNDTNNLIIGVTNIDAIMRKGIEYRKQALENVTYANIAFALAKDYFVIYYVDIETNGYIQYRLNNDTQTLIIEDKGEDFFSDSLMNARRYIVPEDQAKFIKAIGRNNLLSGVENEKTFKLTYRQLIDNNPTYVSMKALRLSSDSNHLIVAVSSIDEQVRRENAYKTELKLEKSLARTDALTGASNKNSYNEFEIEINKHIEDKTLDQFAVLVCDVNNLKQINDTYGHDVGDEYIKDAKNICSSIFKHSTVFRVGGDEFVLILDGHDYYSREFLTLRLQNTNIKNLKENKVVLAFGISEFIPGVDKAVIDVFKRADKLMYSNKEYLKKIKFDE